jgi:hypothetical protein
MSEGKLILYNTDDGLATIGLRAVGGTVWLTQLEMAGLFDTSKQNVSLHLTNILFEGGLVEESVVKECYTAATGGKPNPFRYFNECGLLNRAGHSRTDIARRLFAKCLGGVNANRRMAGALPADGDNILLLEDTETFVKNRKAGKQSDAP